MRDDNFSSPAPRLPVLTWRQQTALAGLFFCLTLLSRIPSFFCSVLDWDESLYFIMAMQWRAGHLPYTTVWDNKPIGIYVIFALFQLLCGPHIFAMRLASCVFVSIGAFAVTKITFLLIRPAAHAVALAIFTGLLFILCALSNDGLSANTELFMAAFTSLAVLAVLSPGLAARPLVQALLTGLCLGAAFMTKYVAVFEAPMVLLLLLFQHQKRDIIRLTAATTTAAAIPLGLTILLYWQAGQLVVWWDDSIVSNLRRLAPPIPRGAFSHAVYVLLLRWGPLVAAAAAMLAMAARQIIRLCRTRRLTDAQIKLFFLDLWLLGGCAGVASSKLFFDHYFLQILPVLCVSLGWLLAQIAPAWTARRLSLVLAASLVLPAMAAEVALADALNPILTWQNGRLSLHPDGPAQIAADINAAPMPSAGTAGPQLFVFNYQPIIYALTGRTPPTAYVLPSVLSGKFLSYVAGVNAAAEIARILAERPAYIVRSPFPIGLPSNINQSVYTEMNQALAANYEIWRSYPGVFLYRLKQ